MPALPEKQAGLSRPPLPKQPPLGQAEAGIVARAAQDQQAAP